MIALELFLCGGGGCLATHTHLMTHPSFVSAPEQSMCFQKVKLWKIN